MKAYGIDKKDDDCYSGHSKYGRKGLTAKGTERPRKKNKQRPAKKYARQEGKTIEL